jgi:C1A family cysteine protease
MTDAIECGEYVDHYVTIVGYSSKDVPEPYWIVKNSMGTTWG